MFGHDKKTENVKVVPIEHITHVPVTIILTTFTLFTQYLTQYLTLPYLTFFEYLTSRYLYSKVP